MKSNLYFIFAAVTVFFGPLASQARYHDDESDLAYYGHRYYTPSQGRWMSRDPINESGGKHLYRFVDNHPITSWDKLGMLTISAVGQNKEAEGCGGWEIAWRVYMDGITQPMWLVQEVTYSANYSKCGGGHFRPGYAFYEAILVNPRLLFVDDDAEPGIGGSYGTQRVLDVATLFPDEEPYSSDIRNWPNNAGSLGPGQGMQSTLTRPNWFTVTEDSATRETWSQWACCCDHWYVVSHSP